MQKIAAIDVGSNAIRMMVGSVNEIGEIEPLENVRLPVRLGQDAFTSGTLGKVTMQQTVDAFRHFRRVADDFGVSRIQAVATSAMREASNRDILLDRVLRVSGIEIEIINGQEEARYVHLAVAHAIDLKGKRAVLIDIGGGSVEVTISKNRKILSTESYNMGTVRLLRKLEGDDLQSSPFRAKGPFSLLVREYAQAARRRIDREIGRAHVDVCVGTGGNVEEMGKLRQKLFKQKTNGQISLSELKDLIEKLSGMSVKDRIRKLHLRSDRADVLLPAAIVLQLIARQAHVRLVTIPHVGLKDGVLLDMADRLQRGGHAPRRAQVWESALQLGRKFQFDADHAAQTARLAGQLFDQSRVLHNLGEEERLLMEVGALLHDIGHFVNTLDHDRHGHYILKANPLIGLNDRQQDVVANLIRYHRRSFPSPDDPNFKALPQKERLTVNKLSALIRLADGLDVSHTHRVTRVTLVRKKKSWELTLHGKGDLMLEKWALNKRRTLFEEMFGVRLEIADRK